ncbi:MAG TPA: tetratricopeptide repeat protein [Bryobacteraceae bacterium]|nr:tetratricopeptide repeat protein [Bryobacteraceae bacterium]
MRRVLAVAALTAGALLAQALPPKQARQTPGSAADAHIGKGTKLMQDELFAAATAEFERALALDPSLARARFQYGVCLLMQGRNGEARKQFEHVRKQTGDSPHLTYYLGRLDLLSNDYRAAIEKLSAVAGKPPYADTAFHLGVAFVSAGDVQSGAKWLERAAKLIPRDYRVHYRLARAYSSTGRDAEAKREYDLYTELRDGHKSTEKQARACTEALRTRPPGEARETCRQMLDPNDAEKLTLLGQLFGDAGKFFEALEPLDRAVKLDPGSFEAWHNLGLTYFRLERYGEARAPLQTAVKLRPEFYGSVVLLGAALYMLGDDAAALPVLERAVRLNPADAQTAAILRQLQDGRRKR